MKKILYTTLLLISIQTNQGLTQSFSLMSSGCDNAVYSIACDASSGNVYAGGNFNQSGGNMVHHVSRWNGSTWSAMDNGMPSLVRSLLFFNNELYAAGDFQNAGSASTLVWMVTKWNGSAWTALGNGLRGVGVYSLAAYQSELYAGGFFDTVYTPGNAIAKWNGSAWVALGTGQNKGVFGAPGYRVRAMRTFGGKLYVGGTFTTAGGVTVNNIAKWDGTSWSAIGTGTNGDVNAFAVHNGDLYAGGNFTTADGVTVNHVARITGNTFAAVGTGTNGVVNALASYQNSLYVSGNFGTSGAVTTQNISRWDGTSWYYLMPSIPGIDGPGYSLTPFNGDLYVGGFFGVAGNLVQANSIVKWHFPVGIDEKSGNENDLQIFPNPAQEKLQLQLNGNVLEKFDLYITDVSGRNLYYQKFEMYNMKNQIDIAFLKSGMYYLRLVNKDKIYITKLVVE